MKRPAESCHRFPFAAALVFLLLGVAGQAFADSKPKFVYVANSGSPSTGDTSATYSVTATAVCRSYPCASPISISGTFTVSATGISGTMYLTDTSDLKSSPVALPFSSQGSFAPDPNLYLFFRAPGGTPPVSYVELIFPFLSFPANYSGGPLCTAVASGCGVISGAGIGGADMSATLFSKTTLCCANGDTAEITSGTVTLTSNSGGTTTSSDVMANYSVTATAVCEGCFLPIAISGTFTLDVTTGIVTGGTMYMTDASDLKSSPLAVPFNLYEPSAFAPLPGATVVFFEVPGRTSAQSPSYVELIFPFGPFPANYSGGPLCTVANNTCGVVSGAEIGTADENPNLYPTTLSGLAAAEMTTGSVTLTGITGGPQVSAGNVSGYAVDKITGALSPLAGSPFAAGSGPSSVAVDPTNKYLYVANLLSDNVSAFAVDGATGALTEIAGSPFAAGMNPISLAVDPLGKFLYVVNQKSNNLSVYTVDSATGSLSPLASSPFSAGSSPASVTVAPSGKFIYITNNAAFNIVAYAIDRTADTLKPVPGSPFNVFGPVSAAVDPSGKFLYVSSAYHVQDQLSVFTINGNNGALTQLNNDTYPMGLPGAVTVAPSGKFLYILDGRPSSGPAGVVAYRIDGSSGALGAIPTSPSAAASDPEAIAIDRSGEFAYVANTLTNKISAYTIDGTSGVLSAIPGSPFTAGAGPDSVAIVGSSGVPFKNFEVRAEIDEDRTTSFAIAGFFTPGAASNGINPVADTVELQVASYSVSIPAGSFQEEGNHKGRREANLAFGEEGRATFRFEGQINGVNLNIIIYQIERSDYLFTAFGSGNILAGVTNPVTVGLTIGEDGGSTTVKAFIDQ